MQDGRIHGALLTPTDDEDRESLYMEAYWGYCLDVIEIDAVDRYAATLHALIDHHREAAIEDYMDLHGVTHDAASTVYRDCRRWATSLSPTDRATRHQIKHQSTIRRTALADVMRTNGEPTTD